MPNFSATSHPATSLHPNTADQSNGVLSVDLLKRFLQLESEIDFLKGENDSLRASHLELEDKFHRQRRLLEETDELNSNLERDGKSLAANYDKLKAKYEALREGSDCGERKWKAQLEESRMKCWKLEVEMKKLEMDLSGDRTGELTEKLKAAERLLEDKNVSILVMTRNYENLERQKDATILEMMNKIKNVEREKMKMEKVLGHRVLELEKSVEEWERFTRSGTAKEKTSGCNFQDKGTGNSKCSGPKSTGMSNLIQPKQENMEADEQFTGPVIEKKHCTPKARDAYIVLISDDEEEEEEKKQPPSFASPSSAERPLAAKRKSEAATCSAEKQNGAAKRCKSNGPTDGKLWEDAKQMLQAFKNNDELCMKSVCALYRKHKSLGVWKNQSDRNNGFNRALSARGVALGKFLTDGDPEGRMKKSAADLVQAYPSNGLLHCKFIAKEHYEILFEMYINNQDPFFVP